MIEAGPLKQKVYLARENPPIFSRGRSQPSRLCAANAADAEDHGGTVFTHAPLEKLEVENGRVSEAMLGGEVGASVSPQYVVNATGAWRGPLRQWQVSR
jgi:glycerol-3-phosphate dehydrogenase